MARQEGTIMRVITASLLALVVLFSSAAMLVAWRGGVVADETSADFNGTWKLVLLAFGEDEFAILDIAQNRGKARAFVTSTRARFLGQSENVAVESLAIRNDTISFELKGPAGVNRFEGKLARQEGKAGKVLGSFTFQGELHPARLEKTASRQVGDLQRSELVPSFLAARGVEDPKSKLKKLQEGLHKYAGNPTNYLYYTEILATAEAAGLSADEVSELIKSWRADAEPYGPAWIGEVRLKALRALGLAKPYAEISLQLAQETDKELDPTANVERRAAIAGLLAYAANLAGKTDIAKEAQARAATLESQIDKEYEKKVPPFHPEAYAGRKDPQADSVVLVELFTGAQCPPCVAVDVAFGALLQTYKPTEMIGLQHHLHIPRPDPLANKDTQARQEYFGEEVGGTPTIFFSGQPDAEGGGSMGDAEAKYKQFREVIDRQLEGKKEADINLSASQSGDEITIHAQATLVNQKEPARSRPKLRLVLTEKAIRYVGTNKLRFHHQVVRDFPGGVEGKDLSSGQGQLDVKLNLSNLKRDIESYLSDYAKLRPFPTPLPEIALENLSVVAFVQDDANKHVLHAASVPVRKITR
jgi:hypothetical protein